jgi:hypothetical protein
MNLVIDVQKQYVVLQANGYFMRVRDGNMMHGTSNRKISLAFLQFHSIAP